MWINNNDITKWAKSKEVSTAAATSEECCIVQESLVCRIKVLNEQWLTVLAIHNKSLAIKGKIAFVKSYQA